MTTQDLINVLEKEHDYYAFEHKGFKCRMIRHVNTNIEDAINNKGFASFNWCGYISVPREHPLYGLSYTSLFEDKADPLLAELNHHAHGGFTYSAGSLYMQPEENLWWFGFDCAHLGDISTTVAYKMRRLFLVFEVKCSSYTY